ncbi:MAG: hypothetical protein AB1656_20640 [Candidatus Omnitrophota bacterium]
MAEYSHAAEQFKETIIEEYLKRNPGVKRSEIMTKLVNGRIVVGTIQEILTNLSSRTSTKTKVACPDRNIVDKLMGEDERLADTVHSIDSSKQYIDWLFSSRSSGFSEDDRNQNIEYLTRHGTICEYRAIDLHEAKMKFAQAMTGKLKPTRSLIHTLLTEYMQTVLEQLKSQRLIYKREVELGDQFSQISREFVRKLRATSKPSVMKAVSKVVEVLKNNRIDVAGINSANDIKGLTAALDRLGVQLEQRREEYTVLQEFITVFESVIEQLKAMQPEAEKEEEDKKSSNRMAFTTRKGR